MDHDQRLKTLLKEFFPEFFELFFPEWRSRFDFTQVEWLDQEIFPDPPEGPKQLLDLVARLPHLGAEGTEPWVALVHVEIESADSVAPLRRRMHWYYANLRHRHNLPVLPLAMYMRVGLDGIGTEQYRESFDEFEVLDFRYIYVGLPALNALDYLERGNSLGLGLTGLMTTPRELQVWAKAQILMRIAETVADGRRRFLLTECVETYFELEDPEQQAEFERLMAQPEYEEARTMAVTSYEKGLEKGRELERQRALDEQRAMIAMLLEQKFGPLPAEVRERVHHMTDEQLCDVSSRLLDADSLADLHLTD
jgi:hypothetical protein